ncbi:MAG: ATP-binding protein [Desulfosporosinus sp.]|nr:ATP-binding protein [Desulfosporosinus sp.]
MKTFRLKGIKGFKDTGDIKLKPITIVIGQNSSGKSSILRFPLVLRQTFQDDSMAPLLFYGKSIDYGNFEDVVFNHDKNSVIEFSISIKAADLLRARPMPYIRKIFEKSINSKEDLIIRVRAKLRERNLVVDHFELRSTKQVIIVFERFNGNYLRFISGIDGNVMEMPEELMGFDKFIPDFRVLDTDDSGMTKKIANEFYYLFSSLSYYFNTMVGNISYIGPFRRTPERFYRYTENSVNHVGSAGEFAPVILGQDMRSDNRLINSVSEWLTENLNYSLDVEDLKGDMFKIVVTDKLTNARNNLIDVGHGLSQLIPIIVQTLMKRNNQMYSGKINHLPRINVIEQPELHLHPAAQSSLADLFVRGIRGKVLTVKCFLLRLTVSICSLGFGGIFWRKGFHLMRLLYTTLKSLKMAV